MSKPYEYSDRMMRVGDDSRCEFAVIGASDLVVRAKENCDRAGCDRTVTLEFRGQPTLRVTVRGVCGCGYEMMREVVLPHLGEALERHRETRRVAEDMLDRELGKRGYTIR